VVAKASDNPIARGQILVNVNFEKGGSFDSFLSSYVKLSPLQIVMEPETHREVSLDAFRNLNGSL